MRLHVLFDFPEIGDSEVTRFMGDLRYLWQDDQLSNLNALAYILENCDNSIIYIKKEDVARPMIDSEVLINRLDSLINDRLTESRLCEEEMCDSKHQNSEKEWAASALTLFKAIIEDDLCKAVL